MGGYNQGMDGKIVLILAKLVGFYFALTGAVFLFYPESLRRYIDFWSKGKRLYAVGLSRFLSAAILLLVVPQCRLKLVVAVVGILNIALGLPYFFRGIKATKAQLDLWDKRPTKAVRILGIASLAVGMLLVYSI
jgi:hypothetical protein